MSNKRVKRVISNLNKQSTFDCLKAGLLRVIRPRNNKKTSDQITQKSTVFVKEQPVQEYLTDSSGILRQINVKT